MFCSKKHLLLKQLYHYTTVQHQITIEMYFFPIYLSFCKFRNIKTELLFRLLSIIEQFDTPLNANKLTPESSGFFGVVNS